MLLKLAKLDYQKNTKGFLRAPKGKLPFIDDNGTIVADSTLIRLHLEQKHGIDFDRGLSARDRGIAWATEKMLEDHLYWVLVYWRWMKTTTSNGSGELLQACAGLYPAAGDMESARQGAPQSARPRHRPSQRDRDDGACPTARSMRCRRCSATTRT